MNICFSYLYRDGANYKQYNEVIFANPSNRTLKEIESIIFTKLINGLWFVAKEWNIPNQFFKDFPYNEGIDHNWHEFDCIKITRRKKTEENTIDKFLELVKNTNLPYY